MAAVGSVSLRQECQVEVNNRVQQLQAWRGFDYEKALGHASADLVKRMRREKVFISERCSHFKITADLEGLDPDDREIYRSLVAKCIQLMKRLDHKVKIFQKTAVWTTKV